MKRFVVAAALAVAVGLGTSGKADAQIVYGYSMPTYNGVVSGGTAYTPFGVQSFQKYYSPYLGSYGNLYAANMFGQAYARSFNYNPWLNMGYRSMYYQPNYYMWPGAGYTWGGFYRRW